MVEVFSHSFRTLVAQFSNNFQTIFEQFSNNFRTICDCPRVAPTLIFTKDSRVGWRPVWEFFFLASVRSTGSCALEPFGPPHTLGRVWNKCGREKREPSGRRTRDDSDDDTNGQTLLLVLSLPKVSAPFLGRRTSSGTNARCQTLTQALAVATNLVGCTPRTLRRHPASAARARGRMMATAGPRAEGGKEEEKSRRKRRG